MVPLRTLTNLSAVIKYAQDICDHPQRKNTTTLYREIQWIVYQLERLRGDDNL